MIYGSEAVLLTDLDYGAPRVRAYDEQGAEASHEDAMDQLDEARDIALLRVKKLFSSPPGPRSPRAGPTVSTVVPTRDGPMSDKTQAHKPQGSLYAQSSPNRANLG